jgi:serine/threonine protein kinase
MEYVEGADLAKIAKNNVPVSPKAMATIGAITAGVLHRAHTAVDPRTRLPLNVVHRDIKPANIMITKNGGVKICDFGVAKARFEGQESRTSPDQILGTLHYMSPEYLRTGEISPAADILALGISLVELLTGNKFGRPKLKKVDHENSVQKLLRSSNLPAKLIAILRQCLHWNPQHRPSAAKLEDELYNIAESLPGLSLRRWAAKSIPYIESTTPNSSDPLGLVGNTITMKEHAMVIDSSLDSPPSQSNLTVSREIGTNINLVLEKQTEFEKYDILFGLVIGVLAFALTAPFYFL